VEYLRQRNLHPLFLTDTGSGRPPFDSTAGPMATLSSTSFEALAPTMERDFDQLPPRKAKDLQGNPGYPHSRISRRTVVLHHRQNDVEKKQLQLIGITDTAMLRPQVFALHDGQVQVGLICSEKQAIDANSEKSFR